MRCDKHQGMGFSYCNLCEVEELREENEKLLAVYEAGLGIRDLTLPDWKKLPEWKRFEQAIAELDAIQRIQTRQETPLEHWDKTRREIWPHANHEASASYVGSRRVAWAGNEHEAGGESRWIATADSIQKWCDCPPNGCRGGESGGVECILCGGIFIGAAWRTRCKECDPVLGGRTE